MHDTFFEDGSCLLSIVVICFKNPDELQTTLSSAAESSHIIEANGVVEFIVVDGSADPGISSVVREFSKIARQLRLLSERDRGIYDAMNKGLHLARGKHIIYMNSGDCFHANGLAAFLSKPRDPAVLYYGDADFFTDGALSFCFKANMQRPRHFLRHNCFSHQAIFYPTDLLKSLGGYRLDFAISADFDLTWRCWRTGCRFKHLAAVIADCDLGGISCQRGLQSYADRVASFQASGAWFYAVLLKAYYPIFLAKNRLVHQLEGSRLLALYRKYKAR